ncbi:MAG: prepilin peptidase [bacterium]
MFIFIAFSFILGLIIGSFLNCVIFRLHQKESFLFGRSHCFFCRKNLKFKDLVPVASFLWQKGRCGYCFKKISWQYPLVELATAVLFSAAVFFHTDAGLNIDAWLILRDWLFISFLIIIFVYDLKHYLILDKVIWPAAIIAVIFNLGLDFSWAVALNLFLSAIAGGSFFLIQYLISRGRWLGGGDVRLGFLMGLMVGWPGVAIAISLAYFIGSLFSVYLVAAKKKSWQSHLPLGTFLTLATVITLFWGEVILDFYLNFVGY